MKIDLRRFLAVALALVMVVSLGAVAVAEDDFVPDYDVEEYDALDYEEDDDVLTYGTDDADYEEYEGDVIAYDAGDEEYEDDAEYEEYDDVLAVGASEDDGVIGAPEKTVELEDGTILCLTDTEDGGVCVTGLEALAETGELVIPDTVLGLKVLKIGEYAFAGNEDIYSVTIPASVDFIGEGAFCDCPYLGMVTFEGTPVIGDSAFRGCSALDRVYFNGGEDGVEVGVMAFDETAWMDEYPIDWITVGDTLIRYKGVDSVVKVPVSVTKIGDGAFIFNPYVERIELTPNVSEIGDFAFYGCENLTYVDIPYASKVKSVGYDAFDGTAWLENCDGEWFIVGNILIRYLGDDYAVCIPQVVSAIAADAFKGAYKLSEDGYSVFTVRVPSSLTAFSDDCFTLFDEDGIADIEPYLFVLKGSAGEAYAEKSGIKYSVITRLGDVDADEEVTAADAREALRIAIGANTDPTLEQIFTADVDGENGITVADARIILRMALGYVLGINDESPATAYEALDLLNKAILYARNRGAGYTKLSYQALDTWNLDANTGLYIGDWKTKGIIGKDDAKAVQYERDSKDAYANLPAGGFYTSDMVEKFTVTLVDGKYTVAVRLNPETVSTPDPNGELRSLTGRLFEVRERSYYDSDLAGMYWFKSRLNSLTFDMTYENCTLVAVIDAETGNLENLTMDWTMHLDNVDGVINVIHVTNKGRTEGTGDIIITGRTVYSGFDYYIDLYPMEETTAEAAEEPATEPATTFWDRLTSLFG
ncbi:MAG: leucine-rich repeat protein [Clostridia bacterium]|nr:leucine-rich repeat protein [Clostridia bacterium]